MPLVLGSCGAGGSTAEGHDGGDTTRGDGGGTVVGGCELVDSDDDGSFDLIEETVGSDPTNPDSRPDESDIVFVVPYQAPPYPSGADLKATLRVSRADVAIVLDTTGSMAGTTARIQSQFQELVTLLAGELDDLAFGAAGYGDFPIVDNANSYADRPFYLVHRMMTATTELGLTSIVDTFQDRNIISDGLGPWFAQMRGGDEPEQGWEALRQVATGSGISYPLTGGGTDLVPPFSSAVAHPATPPAGEEVGEIGGVGFRPDSLPIVVMVTDTEHHETPFPGTTPPSATRAIATDTLHAIGARVIGLKTWSAIGHDDLEYIADETSGRVPPEAWGSGAERPDNCPPGRCCVVADDPSDYDEEEQPLPIDGACSLVFQSDRYDSNFADIVAQAVLGLARGARFDTGAVLRDDEGDDVDAPGAFVESVEALTGPDCAGDDATDTDGDQIADTIVAAPAGSEVCFRVTATSNLDVPPGPAGRSFRAVLTLTGPGLASAEHHDVWFVVPSESCLAPECSLDGDCPPGEFCREGRCRKPVD